MSSAQYSATLSGIKFFSIAPDASTGVLQVLDLCGNILIEFPSQPWSESSIQSALGRPEVCALVDQAFGADAHIGETWIGSTEV